jgi:NADPH-dependent 2,4-dienoyl-CoA reductase/sulfur reductase-like enzyme
MNMIDLAIIGGGAAGLAAALSAHDEKINIVLIERDPQLGGILNQCIHNGFGLHQFKEELTGPEYAHRFIEALKEKGISVMLESTVLDIQKKEHFELILSSPIQGYQHLQARAVILATGCYERTRGSVLIPGTRPKGIMPAGSAQRYLNMEGYLVGQRVFILGSGDIGLIMARRMTLEGAKVLGVAEIMPYSNGLTRNIVQCLHDFDIPLYLSHTVTNIKGKDTLEAITIQAVDHRFEPIAGTEKTFEVDTLLLSIGLIPDVALFDGLNMKKSPVTKSAYVDQHYMTNIEGLFVCGNALHVHDLVDWVSDEGQKAGYHAKKYVLSSQNQEKDDQVITLGDHVRYVVPHHIDMNHLTEPLTLSFRVTKKMTSAMLQVYQDGAIIFQRKSAYLAPAEMESITLKPDQLKSKNPIRLHVEELI